MCDVLVNFETVNIPQLSVEQLIFGRAGWQGRFGPLEMNICILLYSYIGFSGERTEKGKKADQPLLTKRELCNITILINFVNKVDYKLIRSDVSKLYTQIYSTKVLASKECAIFKPHYLQICIHLILDLSVGRTFCFVPSRMSVVDVIYQDKTQIINKQILQWCLLRILVKKCNT